MDAKLCLGYLISIKNNYESSSRYPIIEDSCLIGNSAECNVRIRDVVVTGQQCVIKILRPKEATLYRLCNESQILLNDEPLNEKEVVLKHGDTIQIHNAKFKWEYNESFVNTISNRQSVNLDRNFPRETDQKRFSEPVILNFNENGTETTVTSETPLVKEPSVDPSSAAKLTPCSDRVVNGDSLNYGSNNLSQIRRSRLFCPTYKTKSAANTPEKPKFTPLAKSSSKNTPLQENNRTPGREVKSRFQLNKNSSMKVATPISCVEVRNKIPVCQDNENSSHLILSDNVNNGVENMLPKMGNFELKENTLGNETTVEEPTFEATVHAEMVDNPSVLATPKCFNRAFHSTPKGIEPNKSELELHVGVDTTDVINDGTDRSNDRTQIYSLDNRSISASPVKSVPDNASQVKKKELQISQVGQDSLMEIRRHTRNTSNILKKTFEEHSEDNLLTSEKSLTTPEKSTECDSSKNPAVSVEQMEFESYSPEKKVDRNFVSGSIKSSFESTSELSAENSGTVSTSHENRDKTQRFDDFSMVARCTRNLSYISPPENNKSQEYMDSVVSTPKKSFLMDNDVISASVSNACTPSPRESVTECTFTPKSLNSPPRNRRSTGMVPFVGTPSDVYRTTKGPVTPANKLNFNRTSLEVEVSVGPRDSLSGLVKSSKFAHKRSTERKSTPLKGERSSVRDSLQVHSPIIEEYALECEESQNLSLNNDPQFKFVSKRRRRFAKSSFGIEDRIMEESETNQSDLINDDDSLVPLESFEDENSEFVSTRIVVNQTNNDTEDALNSTYVLDSTDSATDAKLESPVEIVKQIVPKSILTPLPRAAVGFREKSAKKVTFINVKEDDSNIDASECTINEAESEFDLHLSTSTVNTTTDVSAVNAQNIDDGKNDSDDERLYVSDQSSEAFSVNSTVSSSGSLVEKIVAKRNKKTKRSSGERKSKSPCLSGVKRLLSTPKSPKTNYLDVSGVKQLMTTPDSYAQSSETPEKLSTSVSSVNSEAAGIELTPLNESASKTDDSTFVTPTMRRCSKHFRIHRSSICQSLVTSLNSSLENTFLHNCSASLDNSTVEPNMENNENVSTPGKSPKTAFRDVLSELKEKLIQLEKRQKCASQETLEKSINIINEVLTDEPTSDTVINVTEEAFKNVLLELKERFVHWDQLSSCHEVAAAKLHPLEIVVDDSSASNSYDKSKSVDEKTIEVPKSPCSSVLEECIFGSTDAEQTCLSVSKAEAEKIGTVDILANTVEDMPIAHASTSENEEQQQPRNVETEDQKQDFHGVELTIENDDFEKFEQQNDMEIENITTPKFNRTTEISVRHVDERVADNFQIHSSQVNENSSIDNLSSNAVETKSISESIDEVESKNLTSSRREIPSTEVTSQNDTGLEHSSVTNETFKTCSLASNVSFVIEGETSDKSSKLFESIVVRNEKNKRFLDVPAHLLVHEENKENLLSLSSIAVDEIEKSRVHSPVVEKGTPTVSTECNVIVCEPSSVEMKLHETTVNRSVSSTSGLEETQQQCTSAVEKTAIIATKAEDEEMVNEPNITLTFSPYPSDVELESTREENLSCIEPSASEEREQDLISPVQNSVNDEESKSSVTSVAEENSVDASSETQNSSLATTESYDSRVDSDPGSELHSGESSPINGFENAMPVASLPVSAAKMMITPLRKATINVSIDKVDQLTLAGTAVVTNSKISAQSITTSTPLSGGDLPTTMEIPQSCSTTIDTNLSPVVDESEETASQVSETVVDDETQCAVDTVSSVEPNETDPSDNETVQIEELSPHFSQRESVGVVLSQEEGEDLPKSDDLATISENERVVELKNSSVDFADHKNEFTPSTQAEKIMSVEQFEGLVVVDVVVDEKTSVSAVNNEKPIVPVNTAEKIPKDEKIVESAEPTSGRTLCVVLNEIRQKSLSAGEPLSTDETPSEAKHSMLRIEISDCSANKTVKNMEKSSTQVDNGEQQSVRPKRERRRTRYTELFKSCHLCIYASFMTPQSRPSRRSKNDSSTQSSKQTKKTKNETSSLMDVSIELARINVSENRKPVKSGKRKNVHFHDISAEIEVKRSTRSRRNENAHAPTPLKRRTQRVTRVTQNTNIDSSSPRSNIKPEQCVSPCSIVLSKLENCEENLSSANKVTAGITSENQFASQKSGYNTRKTRGVNLAKNTVDEPVQKTKRGRMTGKSEPSLNKEVPAKRDGRFKRKIIKKPAATTDDEKDDIETGKGGAKRKVENQESQTVEVSSRSGRVTRQRKIAQPSAEVVMPIESRKSTRRGAKVNASAESIVASNDSNSISKRIAAAKSKAVDVKVDSKCEEKEMTNTRVSRNQKSSEQVGTRKSARNKTASDVEVFRRKSIKRTASSAEVDLSENSITKKKRKVSVETSNSPAIAVSRTTRSRKPTKKTVSWNENSDKLIRNNFSGTNKSTASSKKSNKEQTAVNKKSDQNSSFKDLVASEPKRVTSAGVRKRNTSTIVENSVNSRTEKVEAVTKKKKSVITAVTAPLTRVTRSQIVSASLKLRHSKK